MDMNFGHWMALESAMQSDVERRTISVATPVLAGQVVDEIVSDPTPPQPTPTCGTRYAALHHTRFDDPDSLSVDAGEHNHQ